MQTPPPIRQGDILLIATNQIPDNVEAVPRDDRGRIILAEGEVTGHRHAIPEDNTTLFAQADIDEMADRFLRVQQRVQVFREEHAALTLPVGDYIVRHKRKYEPRWHSRVVED